MRWWAFGFHRMRGILTSWKPVSFSGRSLLRAVSHALKYPHLSSGLSSVSFFQLPPHNIWKHFSSYPCVPHTQPISQRYSSCCCLHSPTTLSLPGPVLKPSQPIPFRLFFSLTFSWKRLEVLHRRTLRLLKAGHKRRWREKNAGSSVEKVLGGG